MAGKIKKETKNSEPMTEPIKPKEEPKEEPTKGIEIKGFEASKDNVAEKVFYVLLEFKYWSTEFIKIFVDNGAVVKKITDKDGYNLLMVKMPLSDKNFKD